MFNLASGAHEHVGNYSGVTVDAKEGYFDFEGYHFKIVDLPGTYSLSAYTPEEIYVRRHIIDETPDVIINVVDSSNLERNLYLTTQLIDMNAVSYTHLDVYKRQALLLLLLLLSRGRITRGRGWFCACSGAGRVIVSALVDSNLPNNSVGNSTFSDGRSSIGMKSSSELSDRILLSSSTTAGALGLIIGLEIGLEAGLEIGLEARCV